MLCRSCIMEDANEEQFLGNLTGISSYLCEYLSQILLKQEQRKRDYH